MRNQSIRIPGPDPSCPRIVVHRSRVIFSLALALVMIIVSASAVAAEYLFMNDGSIVEGAITKETDDAVTMALPKGGIRTVPRQKILRTLYRTDFLYRQAVKMYSGETFEGFLVDETEDKYRFRKELFSTSERTVKKDEVIYLRKKELYSLDGKKQKEYSILDFTPALSLRGAVIVPFGDFGTIYRLGYGGGLGFDFRAIRKTGWGIGIDAGCWYLQGVKSGTWGIVGSAMLRFYHEFRAASWFGIAPVIAGGFSANYIRYKYRGYGGDISYVIFLGTDIVKAQTSYKPVLSGGIDFLFWPSKSAALMIEARYGAIFENKKVMHMVSVSPAVRFLF